MKLGCQSTIIMLMCKAVLLTGWHQSCMWFAIYMRMIDWVFLLWGCSGEPLKKQYPIFRLNNVWAIGQLQMFTGTDNWVRITLAQAGCSRVVSLMRSIKRLSTILLKVRHEQDANLMTIDSWDLKLTVAVILNAINCYHLIFLLYRGLYLLGLGVFGEVATLGCICHVFSLFLFFFF